MKPTELLRISYITQSSVAGEVLITILKLWFYLLQAMLHHYTSANYFYICSIIYYIIYFL